MLYAVLYVHVNCFVGCGFAVSSKYMNVCNSDVFSVVNMYLDHLKFCVLMVEGKSVVNGMLSPMSVMSPPPPVLGVFALG